MVDRTANDFWAIWKSGKDWPELFANEETAKNRAHQLAKENVGQEVFLLKITPVGSAVYPAQPMLSGALSK